MAKKLIKDKSKTFGTISIETKERKSGKEIMLLQYDGMMRKWYGLEMSIELAEALNVELTKFLAEQ
jgi:hypothetical protein